MRLSVVEMSEDETIFYNIGVFREHEDLIVFPMHEFQNFYEEMEHRVRCIKNIVGMEGQILKDPTNTVRDLEPHLELLERELELLLDFNVQTTLESFQKLEKEADANQKISDYEKEKPQCLMGL
jgi:hypothetical protein